MRRLLLVLAIACSSPTPEHPDAGPDASADPASERSGSRLKRRGHDLDGTRAFDRIFDSVRAEECAVAAWSDGNRYCTPFASTGYVVFSDASCTTRVGFGYTACPATGPTYFAEYASQACGDSAVARLFERGADSSATTYYRALPDGSCDGPSALSANEKLFVLGPELPASALVRVTETTEPGSERVRRTFVESEDGLRVASGVTDTTLGFGCMLQQRDSAASEWTCLPRTAGYAGDYADATCTTPAAPLYGDCPAPPFVLQNTKPACRWPAYEGYRTAGELATAYADVGGTCTPYEPEVRTVAAGARIDLATLERVLAGESSRIKRVHADAHWVSMLHDEVRQTNCTIAPASDGVRRCLPIGNFVQHYYRDAACTQPIDVVRVYRGLSDCELQPKPELANALIASPTDCVARHEIHRVGAEVTGTLYAKYDTCTMLGVPSTVTLYEAGAIVPPTDFVAATPVTEL